MQVTTGKRRNPASIGYNNLIAVPFTTTLGLQGTASSSVGARVPLGLNLKVMAVSYVVTAAAGTVTGVIPSFNIVSGAGTYETLGNAPTGTLTIGGTFAIGDTISLVVGGLTYKITISSRNAGNNNMIAADMAAGIKRSQPFGTSPAYFATSAGSVLYVQQIAYSVAGNSTTFSSSVVSASGTATVSAATLTNGQGSAGAYAAGTLVVGGTVVATDTIAWTVGTFSGMVTATDGVSADLAGLLLASINTTAGTIVTASRSNSGSSTVNITANAEGTAGNAIALSATYTRVGGGSTGTVTASGANLTGGIAPVAGTTPTMPALDNSNQTAPAQTAAAGTALFPVDVAVSNVVDTVGVVYPTYPNNFEAIFPAGTELTLRGNSPSNSYSATISVVMWCVPYDINAFNPELKANGFIPNPTNL